MLQYSTKKIFDYFRYPICRFCSSNQPKIQTISVQTLFKQRYLFYQSNSPDLSNEDFIVKNYGKKVYCGYDPTSSSLHIGNLVSVIMLARLNALGLQPLLLIGGATGLIGDPSGKNKQRQLLQVQTVKSNIQSISKQLNTIFKTIKEQMLNKVQQYQISQNQIKNLNNFQHKILNNYDFYQHINFIDFLRNIGKNFRMSPLLSKQAVSRRLESEQGLSYAQFSYALLQSYDFCHLFQKQKCIMQIGGSDQWGNITNGTQLIKKKFNSQAYAVTMPLLLTKSGAKFGKSQGNALYLNSEKTSLKEIYQYFYNTADEDLQKYLCIFTFYSKNKIHQIIKQHNQRKQLRRGQQILAQSIINLLGSYKHIQKQYFKLSHDQLIMKNFNYYHQLFSHIQKENPESLAQLHHKQIQNINSWPQFLVFLKLCKSRNEARKQIQAGGLYLNNRRLSVQQANQVGVGISEKVFSSQLIKKYVLQNQFLVIRWGKKKYQFVRLSSK